MLITWVGGAGIGLVWGWLIEQSIGRTDSQLLTRAVLQVGAVLLSIQMYLLADLLSAYIFITAVLLSLLIHLGWLRWLRLRSDRYRRGDVQ